jgi:hypothetical protein
MIEKRRKEAESKVADDPNASVEVLRLEKRADAERRLREYDKAVTTLSEAMTLRIAYTEKLKSANLDTSAEISATVKLLHTFGQVFSEKGDSERAERAFKDASRLLRKHLPSKSLSAKKGDERVQLLV